MNSKEYQIFKLKIEISEMKKTISCLETENPYLFFANKSNYYKADKNSCLFSIKESLIKEILVKIEDKKKEIVNLS